MKPGYQAQYIASWVVAVGLIVLGAIQIADATRLGIPPTVDAWIDVAVAALGGIALLLPKVTKPPTPERKGLD